MKFNVFNTQIVILCSMLNSVFKDAIKRRDEILQILHGPKFEQIREEARRSWTPYTPKKHDAVLIGIDSSYNSKKLQGMEMWAATAVATKSDGAIISERYDFGLGHPEKDLSVIASGMEVDVCVESTGQSDYILMDGSLYSQFLRQQDLKPKMINTIKEKKNIIFVSKTSSMKLQFKNLNPPAGDIFYYNHASQKAGFSRIYEDTQYGPGNTISSMYVRLGQSLPIIKVELLGEGHTQDEIKSLMDIMYKDSVSGYPYCLRMAHNTCKVENGDLAKLTSMYGISLEISSRAVLE